MKTNAVRILEGLNIPYQLRSYPVDPEDLKAESVAEKIGMHRERETIFKGFPTDVFAINR